ncbi:MAG: hypothetical protein LBT38_05165 [Deltaproteobacteria bacterium]|nr:hypothetical protein [Deltaproteobacteria bacterium]
MGSINRQTRGSVGQKRVDIDRGYGLAIVVSLWLLNFRGFITEEFLRL